VSARTAARAALVLTVLMSVLGLVFAVLLAGLDVPGGDNAVATAFIDVVLVIPFLSVGPLLVARRPDNAIGWLFCGVALLWAFSGLTMTYGAYALYSDAGLPAARLALWASNAVFVVPLFLGPLYLFLLFPDGRLLSPRWRLVSWALAGLSTIGLLSGALRPGYLDGPIKVKTPVAVHGPVGDFLGALDPFLTAGVGILFVLCATSLILRLRRSRGLERLQIKWVVYLAAVAMVCFVIVFAVGSVAQYVFPVGMVALACIPLAAGLAILRYRLYEIDRVINRTLVYAALTAILVGAYLGSVLLLQLALDPVTSGSSLAVAVSTLAVAALFRPARARVQAAVDRRFYRRRYDAARTLEEFSARLREQVDLEALGAELRTVVAETMQPAHVSLWLREAQR
jgi:hypothetical protein